MELGGSIPLRGTKLGDFVDNPEGNMLTKREWLYLKS